jgi:hypothetical protein
MLWRIALCAAGLACLAVATADAYQILSEPSVLGWTLGTLHAVFYFVLGAAFVFAACRMRADEVRWLAAGFFSDVVSKRNLIEASIIFFGALAVAAVLAVMHPK